MLVNDRTEPVFVNEIDRGLHENHRVVTVVQRVTCDGSRGGTVILEETECGQIRVLRGFDGDARNVSVLQRTGADQSEPSAVLPKSI